MIKGVVIKLAVRQIRVKGPKLSIGPPVLLSGESVDEVEHWRGRGTEQIPRGLLTLFDRVSLLVCKVKCNLTVFICRRDEV